MCYRAATARERYHERRCIALRFLAVAVRFWFRLCRVRESVPLVILNRLSTLAPSLKSLEIRNRAIPMRLKFFLQLD